VAIPRLTSAPWLIGVLIAGTPFYGTLFAPASALVAAGAERLGLNQGIAFAVSNLTWAAGQSIAASGSGALAQATSDLVPYTLLTVACLGTFLTLGRVRRARAQPAAPESSAESRAAD
jgi:hypothetical protein